MPNEKLSEVLSELARCLTVLENDNREMYNRAIEIEEEEVSIAVQQRAFHIIRRSKSWHKTLEQLRRDMDGACVFSDKFEGADSITASKAASEVRKISELAELEGHAGGKFYAPTNFASANFAGESGQESAELTKPLFNEPEPEPVHRSAAEIPLDSEIEAEVSETDVNIDEGADDTADPYEDITTELSRALSDLDSDGGIEFEQFEQPEPPAPSEHVYEPEFPTAENSESAENSDNDAFFDDSELTADKDIIDPFAEEESDESGITVKSAQAPVFDMSESLDDSDFEDFFLDPNLVEIPDGRTQSFSGENAPEIFNDALVDFESDLLTSTPVVVPEPVKPDKFGGKKPKSIMIFGKETKVNNWRDLFKIVCESLTAAAPFIAQQFSGNEEINTPKRIFSNFESDIAGEKMKLSSGVWVSAELTSDEIYTLSRRLFVLCGKPANSFSIRT